MAVNADLLEKNFTRAKVLGRPSDRRLFLAAAILFPIFVLIGYFKTYYFSRFFPDARPIANNLVHLHGIVMTVWVLYFAAQIALVRTKNIKLHITMGMFGVVLAALARIPIIGENFGIFGAFGIADLLAISGLIWHTRKHGKLNKVFAVGVALLIVSHPFQIIVGASESWIRLVGWIFS